MLYYGVASHAVSEIIAFYSTRDEAEAVLSKVLEQVPELSEDLFIEEVEFATPSMN